MKSENFPTRPILRTHESRKILSNPKELNEFNLQAKEVISVLKIEFENNPAYIKYFTERNTSLELKIMETKSDSVGHSYPAGFEVEDGKSTIYMYLHNIMIDFIILKETVPELTINIFIGIIFFHEMTHAIQQVLKSTGDLKSNSKFFLESTAQIVSGKFMAEHLKATGSILSETVKDVVFHTIFLMGLKKGIYHPSLLTRIRYKLKIIKNQRSGGYTSQTKARELFLLGFNNQMATTDLIELYLTQ